MAFSARPMAGNPQTASRPASEALQRLKAGQISLEDYLDDRAEQAMDHVRGKIPAEMLETIRTTLKDQMRSDPVLVELVRRATGQIPEPLVEDLV